MSESANECANECASARPSLEPISPFPGPICLTVETVEQYKKKKIHLDVWKLQRVKIRMNESLSRASDGLISLKRRLSSLDAAN